MHAYIIVLAVEFRPAALKYVVAPRGELPVKLFIERPEETKNLDRVKGSFGVKINCFEFLDDVVHEWLNTSGILVVKYILRSRTELV